MRIVVVEDEERSRLGMSRLVRSINEGYFVVAQAANGKEALEMIRIHRPDVVLTDIKMPFLDGLQLIETAQTEGLFPHFVIISAFTEFEYAKKAISFGVREFIVKPVTYDDVGSILQKLESLPPNPQYIQQRTDLHPLVSKMLCDIKENYARKISLESLADTLGVTPEYLSTLFSREMGESFSTYLQRYRIEQAKEIFDGDENAKVYEVAASLGFSDVKYFYKVFKKVTGQSPSQYARRHS